MPALCCCLLAATAPARGEGRLALGGLDYGPAPDPPAFFAHVWTICEPEPHGPCQNSWDRRAGPHLCGY